MQEDIVIKKNKKKNNGKSSFRPARVLALGFIALIIIGAILLSLPIATTDEKGTPFLNALFTATSAVCVTGLVVVDTGTYFTIFGQMVILVLIELGGLGFMTFATLFAIILGRKITLKERILLQEAFNQLSLEGIVRLVKSVLQIAFAIQLLGALLLTLRWQRELGLLKAAYYGIFHAISAFNNAGFDLSGGFKSLTGFTEDPFTNLVVISLVILGGLGFVVLSEIYVTRGRKLNLHSQLVLISTSVLILVGTAVILFLEYNNPQTLLPLSSFNKGMAALFQAVTPRTAGFNTIPVDGLRETTLLFLMILMFIGANPGSTGGGIKTTTFVSLLIAMAAIFKGHKEYMVLERTLPRETVEKAMTITISGMCIILLITGVLTMTEQASFLPLLFETVSAFGTVGLSLGVTPELTIAGKIAIMFTMYVGRVGTVTLAFALAQRRDTLTKIKYPEERILIG